jgi:hypothetical protein
MYSVGICLLMNLKLNGVEREGEEGVGGEGERESKDLIQDCQLLVCQD